MGFKAPKVKYSLPRDGIKC